MDYQQKQDLVVKSVYEYYSKHGVTQDSVVSDDFRYIQKFLPSGKRKNLCKNLITENHNSLSIFWAGWIYRLDRLETLLEKLKLQHDVALTAFAASVTEYANGRTKNVIVPLDKVHDNRYHLLKVNLDGNWANTFSLGRKKVRPPKEPYHKMSWSWDWTQGHMSQYPCASKESNIVSNLYKRYRDVCRRQTIVKRGFNLALNCWLDGLMEYYDPGEQISFTVGNKQYYFIRREREWEVASPPQTLTLPNVPEVSGHHNRLVLGFRNKIPWHTEQVKPKKTKAAKVTKAKLKKEKV